MNKKHFWKKKIIGIFLAAAMVASILTAHQLMAAPRVETDRTVTLTALVDLKDGSVFASEFAGKVEIEIYKLATLSEVGKPTLDGRFADAGIDLTILDNLVDNNDVEVSVEQVKTSIVEKAVTKATDLEPDMVMTLDRGNQQASVSQTIEKGAGIYLYIPREAMDERYSYKFTPYIICAPTSDYIKFGRGQSDAWDYTSVFNLKSQAYERYGSLEIKKTLDNFNASLQGQSFVYTVTAKIDDETVFSNVYTIDFTAAGTRSRTIDKLPAQAQVTVTETYTGSSYDTVGGDTKTAIISADEPQVVEFENKYNDKLIIGGIAAENNFVVDDGTIFWIDKDGNKVEQFNRIPQ